MSVKTLMLFVCLTCPLTSRAATMIDGFYCGQDNCYDVLKVAKQATRTDIAKAYRKLAKTFHPDLFRNEKDKSNAEENFKRIANAYEILKDEESRRDYDHLLDHPDEVYGHYVRYYRRRVPWVDVRLVIVLLVSAISVVQYYAALQRYRSAIEYLESIPRHRNKALKIALERGFLDNIKKSHGKNKVDIKKETDAAIRKAIMEYTEIQGTNAKPAVLDVLVFQLILLPHTLVRYVCWYTRWVVRHKLRDLPYNDEEKLYLIGKYMKNRRVIDALTDSEKQKYLNMGLWDKDKFDKWSKGIEEEEKRKQAEASRREAQRSFLEAQKRGGILSLHPYKA